MPTMEKTQRFQEIADHQADWIGGTLEEQGDHATRGNRLALSTTQIIGVRLQEEDGQMVFEVEGVAFNCQGSLSLLGEIQGEPGWRTFYGFNGHTWRIRKP